MEYFPIRAFRPFETKTENTDQDRTVLRLCDGFVALPIGALCSGPEYYPLWGIDDLPARCATALAGANASKAHFVTVARAGHVFIVVWSLSLSKPLGFFHVTSSTPTDYDFDSEESITVASPVNEVYRDKDGSAPWFASRIGSRWYIGNGVDDNLQWHNGALSLLGPAAALDASEDIYNPSRVKIPACTTFAMNGTRSVFAAGNAAAPLRVWITNPPTSDFPFNEGIYSLTKSYIDVTFSEATRITALSAYQNYITAHTDAKPVNLFDVDGTNDGWKCVQAAGAANASAPSPACVRDTNGMQSFYLGADGEVYKDEAVRVGPNDKRPARDQEIATGVQANSWNRDMLKPLTSGKAHTFYDRTTELYWMFAELAGISGRFGLWTYYERSRTVSGPFTRVNGVASAVIAGNSGSANTLVAVITGNGEMLYADFSNIGELEEYLNDDDGAELGADFEVEASAPTPTPGLGYVAQSADNETFAEYISGGDRLVMLDPWNYLNEDDTAHTFTKFYKDGHLARFETGYLDFGSAQVKKNYLELRMTWMRRSRAYVGIYAQTEDGRMAGKWKGLVYDKEEIRVPVNLCGHRIRVRVVAVLFNAGPALVREMTIGWLPAGTT